MNTTQVTPPPSWRFDHVNVVTNAHPQALAFFKEVMGLHSGDRPPFTFPGDWLYQQDNAYVHAVHAPRAAEHPSLSLHHLAFRTDEPGASVLQRVQASGLPYRAAVIPQSATLQIFVTLPGGLVMELNAPH